MKIFQKNITKYTKTNNLSPKLEVVNKMKYLPAFSKEWKNIIYSYNKNHLKNLPANNVNMNKIIQSYFTMFFPLNEKTRFRRFLSLKRRRRIISRIFVSNANVKYTNSKAKITLYTVNPKQRTLQKKYHFLSKVGYWNLFRKYTSFHRKFIAKVYSSLTKKYQIYNDYFFVRDFIPKSKYISYKLKYLHQFLKLKNLVLKKMWAVLIQNFSRKHFKRLRKYNFLHSLNQFQFNKSKLLSQLSYVLKGILGRKIEYNIINLKSISHHPDIFTNVLALKIQKDKRGPGRRIRSLLNRTKIQPTTIEEKAKAQKPDKVDLFRNNYRDLKILSHMKDQNFSNVLTKILTNDKKVHNTIFHSIGYKNVRGMKLLVSGRLTKRYRADRAIQVLKWKGGLKNIDSSFKKVSAVSFRGNTNANVSYSFVKSKRRIGSFAVKGWIAGK